MVSQIYHSALQLNNTKTADTEAAFFDLHLSISYDVVTSKFMINVTILILTLSISQFQMVMFLALHSIESISLNPFNLLEHLPMLLTSTLAINCLLRHFLKQGYQYHKLSKTFFSKFYRRYYDMISKFQVGLKFLLRQ